MPRHDFPPKIAPANILIDGVNKLFKPLAFIAVFFGGLIATLGVVLIYLGNTGTTTLSLFGQKVNTSSVGIAAIGLGCFVATSALTKIINVMGRAMDRILRRKDLFEKPTQ
jgi:uncharacterized membrane protein